MCLTPQNVIFVAITIIRTKPLKLTRTMKKVILLLAAVFAITTAGFSQPRTKSNVSISFNTSNIPDVKLAAELGFGGKVFTLLVGGGCQYLLGEDRHGNLGLYGPNGFLSLEPRLYFNLDRRDGQGKNTYGNSGNFFAFEVRPVFSSETGGKELEDMVILSPVWGFKRVYFRHLMLEVKAGFNFSTKVENGGLMGLNLGARIGYMF